MSELSTLEIRTLVLDTIRSHITHSVADVMSSAKFETDDVTRVYMMVEKLFEEKLIRHRDKGNCFEITFRGLDKLMDIRDFMTAGYSAAKKRRSLKITKCLESQDVK